jgi:CheY-like chemotaxis protein
LSLPLLRESRKAARKIATPVAASCPATVLVVDNDPAIIAATTALLGGIGHTVVPAGNIAEAVAKAAIADVALIDFHLDNGEDGIVLIDRLRKLYPELPIALVTAESGTSLRRRAKRRGIALLIKPVAPSDLESFVGTASMREVEP